MDPLGQGYHRLHLLLAGNSVGLARCAVREMSAIGGQDGAGRRTADARGIASTKRGESFIMVVVTEYEVR